VVVVEDLYGSLSVRRGCATLLRLLSRPTSGPQGFLGEFEQTVLLAILEVSTLLAAKRAKWHRRQRHMQINAIEQWPCEA
jgi:hypothetical protein